MVVVVVVTLMAMKMAKKQRIEAHRHVDTLGVDSLALPEHI